MKTRTGFVSNSSSSSFVIMYRGKEQYDYQIHNKKVFVDALVWNVKRSSPGLVAELKRMNKSYEKNLTMREVAEEFFDLLVNAKQNLTMKEFAEEVANGYDSGIDDIEKGKLILWQEKEGKKRGLTATQIDRLYCDKCGLDEDTVRDIQDRYWKYRRKVNQELAKLKALAILNKHENAFLIQFEVSDNDGMLHSFLEHHFIESAFKYGLESVFRFSHH